MRLTHFVAATAIAVSAIATTASAGGFAATVIEPQVIIPLPPAQRSSWGIILPLLAVGVLIALAMSNEEDSTPNPS